MPSRRPDIDLSRHPGAKSLGIDLSALREHAMTREAVAKPAGADGPKVLAVLPAGPRGRWVVEIPGFALLSLNRARGKHWSAEYRMKKRTYKAMRGPMLAAGVTQAQGRRLVGYRVERPDRKHADLENVLKICNDPLKWLGVIVDDGPDDLEFGGYATGDGAARTVLTIEDIREGTR